MVGMICIHRIMIALLLRRFHPLPLFFGDNRLMQAIVELIFIILNPLLGKVHMGRFLVHMHHSGYDGFRRLLALDELQSVFKKLFYLPGLLTLEEHRAGSNQRLHHPDAVFPGTASMARRASFRAFHCVSSI